MAIKMGQKFQQHTMEGDPANIEPKGIMTETEEKVYKAIRDQLRPLTYEDMKQIPRLSRIRSFDRHVRNLVKKKRLKKNDTNPPKFEVKR